MACFMMYTASWLIFGKNRSRIPPKLTTFDLQLFAGEKTEEPTAKRQQEARSKGQIPRSVEVNSVLVILLAFVTLRFLGQFMYEQMIGYMRVIFMQLVMPDMTITTTLDLFANGSLVLAKTCLPVLFVVLITSLVINYLQVGFVFTFEPLMPSLGKLDPLAGFQRLFSKRSLVELVKSIIKIVIIGYFIFRFIGQETLRVPSMIDMELIDSFQFAGNLIMDLIYQISGVMIVLAILDYLYQGWQHKESLKMSKDEVKEESKQSEGNPEVKSKIKEKQRAMAMRRMMQEIPKASVVVTNPTHYAVALQYEKDMGAPVVVAKGQDLVAQRIKKIAREHSVAIVENKPLARILYSSTDLGETIPQDLYQAVAEVLAYVYRLKKRSS